MKRAAIYARVSTDIQAEMGYSLPTQLEACRKYAQANGFTVAAELADDCSGSIPVAERPQGRRLYELVDSGQLQAVIIFTHDRTARDDRVLEYLLLKNYLYDRSVELHYSDTGLDPRTFEGDLIGYIKSYTAAEERRKIVERATRGKLAKARSGKIVLNGHLPYGYQKVGRGRDAHVVVNEEEAEIVKMIFAWYVGGDEFGVPISMGNIAYRLMQMKIPTARGGSYWSVTVVKEILTCEFYAGRA